MFDFIFTYTLFKKYDDIVVYSPITQLWDHAWWNNVYTVFHKFPTFERFLRFLRTRRSWWACLVDLLLVWNASKFTHAWPIRIHSVNIPTQTLTIDGTVQNMANWPILASSQISFVRTFAPHPLRIPRLRWRGDAIGPHQLPGCPRDQTAILFNQRDCQLSIRRNCSVWFVPC